MKELLCGHGLQIRAIVAEVNLRYGCGAKSMRTFFQRVLINLCGHGLQIRAIGLQIRAIVAEVNLHDRVANPRYRIDEIFVRHHNF
ncbi:hypothetical protein [Flavobacterium ginsenosidimutans]|uniref:Transposase n=1 Tax=Flavobacterium ginsenosidimutans TaxID=687844 RepID=A0ABZ2Q8V4_9FLAO